MDTNTALNAYTVIKASEKSSLFETASIKTVFELIQQRSSGKGLRVVAVDLDNTAIHPEQTIGSDQWFVHQLAVEKTLIDDAVLAKTKTVELFYDIQHKTKVSLVEPEIVEIIKKLQEAGYLVIGLTARGKKIAELTHQQLLSVGINFNIGLFADTEKPCINNPEKGIFKYKIMFVDGAEKGIALNGLLEALGINPDEVFFIDDSLRHVTNVEEHTQAKYTGFHYTYVKEEKGLAIDPHVANMQLRYLNTILPDKVAKAVHEHHETEVSNTHLKICFNQKEAGYKPYAYFWGNHQKDHQAIQSFFNEDQCKPKIKHDFFSFKPDNPVMAYRFKVPLEKTEKLMTFLYEHQILKQHDVEQVETKLTDISQKINKISVK